MRSALIAIGCDRYESLQRLEGAEADATKVFEALTAPGQPYAKEHSRLLLSPLKSELESALLGMGSGEVDVLTLYFAGHGGTKEGGYYFCLADTRGDRLSLTGYPLNSWLNFVRELRPRYSYLIADSCESGGSHHDIRDILSDPRLGQESASTFACLAASSRNQSAHEANGAGLMTAELLKVFDGRLMTGSEQAELDLMEVARVVGTQFEDLVMEQRPVAWGLNFFGPGRLCRNPHYTTGNSRFHVPEVPIDSMLAKQIAQRSEDLWNLYRSADNGLDYEDVRQLVMEVGGGPETSVAERASFIFGLAQAFSGRLRARGTPWEAAEALGAFASFLLHDVRSDPAVADVARGMVRRKLKWELDLVDTLAAQLAEMPTVLLNGPSGFGDFFYLPLRLSKLFATIAQATFVAGEFGLHVEVARVQSAVHKLLDLYPLAFKALSDQQAPSLLIWFHYAAHLGWQAEHDVVFGSIFTDLVDIGGKVARCDLPARLACEYLLARGRDTTLIRQSWLANPSTLLAVVLIVACDNQLDDEIDGYLEVLDHQKLNLYFPADYRTFAASVMEGGVNRTHEIGADIWKCADFRAHLATHWSRDVVTCELPVNTLEQVLVNCAALVFPDRLPLALRKGRQSSENK